MTEYFRIGSIVRPHGIHGDVKVIPETDDAKRFQTLDAVYLEGNGEMLPVSVSNIRIQHDSVILHIKNVDTVEEADRIRGCFLCVDRSHAVLLPPHAYFIADLIGCEVWDTDKVFHGMITDVYSGVAQDVYVVDGGSLSFPALKKLIVSFDHDSNRMVLDAEILSEVGLFEN